MKKALKKILSFLLAIIMVMGSIPSIAYATDHSDIISENNESSNEPQYDLLESLRASETDGDGTSICSGNGPAGESILDEEGYKYQLNENGISYSIVGYIGSAKNIVIPDTYMGLPVTRICNYAFNNRVSIQNIIIPESIIRIDENVFDGCTNLNYHTVDGGRYIGSYVSYDKEKSMEENISNPLYYFAGLDMTDEERNAITEFTVAEGTVIVGSHTLYHCENLLSAIFPTSVQYMGYNAIGWCDKLESVTLPFIGNDGVSEENAHFGWVFGARTKGGNISYVPLSLKNVTIFGGNIIDKGSFYGVDSLVSIVLPFLGHDSNDSQTSYLSYLWNGTSYEENIVPQGLKTITINSGIIGTGAFYQYQKAIRLLVTSLNLVSKC